MSKIFYSNSFDCWTLIFGEEYTLFWILNFKTDVIDIFIYVC
jgi:hypothetical protein